MPAFPESLNTAVAYCLVLLTPNTAFSWVLWLIGFRVLYPRNANQRKVILRFVYRNGYNNYEWVDTRCGIRYQ
jgi:hypothetical protein